MGDPEVGRQLRALRTAAGRTVASVAADAGLSVPYIANLENGRGNPTATALSQLAGALGMRLVISLVPAGSNAGARSQDAAEVPPSLVRLARTPRFQQSTQVMAASLDVDLSEFTSQIIGALALIAGALHRDPGEADWWRLLDALLLVATSPASSKDLPPARGPR